MDRVNEVTAEVRGREVTYTRILDAPRELVFRAFTERDHVTRWWGPWGFTITTHEMDARPGGVWRFDMRGPDGTNYPNRITYLDVVPPERLHYKHGADTEPDNTHFEVTISLRDRDGKTELEMRCAFDSAETLRHLIESVDALERGKQTLTSLAEYVATM